MAFAFFKRLNIFLFLCCSATVVNAQCENFGIIHISEEGCGNLIIDVETGDVCQLPDNDLDLASGSVVAYLCEATSESYTCGDLTITPVHALCLTEVEPSLATEIVCDYSECVHPGDADTDMQANAFDLLWVGLGYGSTGPSRSSADNSWEAQMASDWIEETSFGINYKHLDCNGDGTIDEADRDIILSNYSYDLLPTNDIYEGDVPELNVNFPIETLVFDDSSPAEFVVEASISVSDMPVSDLHGLSFSLEYSQDLLPPHSVHSDYVEGSFFGAESDNLWLEKDLYTFGRNDFALSRKAGDAVNGEGELFTTSFVIIVDIIDGRSENETPFTVRLKNVQAIDSEGNPVTIKIGEDATFTIINNTNLSSNNKAILAAKTNLSPNPAQSFLTIETGDLQAQHIEVIGATGRKMISEKLNSNQTVLDISNLNTGLYFAHIQTEEGLVTKKLLVE